MKKLSIVFNMMAAILLLLSSCVEDDMQMSTAGREQKFKVVLMSTDTKTTRVGLGGAGLGGAIPPQQQVLQFATKEDYYATLDSIKRMDEPSKREFFKSIGFEGAYVLLARANDEMDAAFDEAETVDSITGVNIIRNCVSKHQGVMIFNDVDTYDVTPYLPFDDEDAELLGSITGCVIIGDSIIKPTELKKPPYNGSFIRYDAYVKVKNGKYSSYCRLGRIGANMAFELETYRKIWFFKKYDKKCCYDGELEISGNNKTEVAHIHNTRGTWKLYSPVRVYSPRVNMKVTDFSSTRNSNKKVSKEVKNILVR